MQSFPSLLADLAKTIRRLREPTGLSQEKFASAIKRHRTKIGNLEQAKGNPTLKTLHNVAEGLGVSVAELFAAAAGKAGEAAGREHRPASSSPMARKSQGRTPRRKR